MALSSSIQEKLTAIAENEQKVYYAGYANGTKGEYDKFWDSFQQNGNRRNYKYGFAGHGWFSATFRPKYDIIMTAGMGAFQEGQATVDLKARLEECGVVLDTSELKNFTYIFYGSHFSALPHIDATNATVLTSAYQNAYCKSFGITLKDDGSQTFSSTFLGMGALENVDIQGKIGQNISFANSSRLTIEGLRSIITALYDFVGNGETTTRTLTLHADAKARLTENDISNITSKGWTLV